jgi:exodeoxyribonuclease-3
VLRLVSANVNGVRAALRRGGLAWLVACRPDVLCLQEVRADDSQLADVLDEAGLAEWHVASTAATAKGRAGVAVLSRAPLAGRRSGVPGFEAAGRWVEADVPTSAGVLTVVSTYVPTGEAGAPRQLDKMRFLGAMTYRMGALAADADRLAVVTGDLNVAHRREDLRNWKANVRKAGCLPEERAVLDTWLGGGWVDVHRALAGDGVAPYTWWTWRGQAFDTDTGWRIDYQLATSALAARALDGRVGRAGSYAERWSDHAAVVVDYDLELGAEPGQPVSDG